jgi:SAM-dependent methyltransferase
MSLEEEYYENDAFWNNENLRDINIGRIKTLSKMIPEDLGSILDVGCGNGRSLSYLNSLNKNFRLLGVDRCKAALKYVKTPKTKSSIDFLPFSNNEFDFVSAREVIEDLPSNIFLNGLKQLCRVSKKYILISVPNNQDLERTLIECPQCKTMFNPDYHMRSFNENDLRELFGKMGFKCGDMQYIGISYEYFPVSKIMSLFRFFKICNNPFPTNIPCPVCGCYLKAKECSSSFGNNLKQKGKDIVKSIFPKAIRYVWIAALYKKFR